jgi:hypothetical protein
MSNETLSKLLELAESNLNENEYIQVADILKKAHILIPNKDGSIHLPEPFRVKYFDFNGELVSLFEVFAFEKSPFKFHTSYRNNDLTKVFNYRNMEDFIKYKLNSVCVTDLFIDGWLGNEAIMYENFSSKYRHDEDCDCNEHHKMEYHDDIILKYVDILMKNLKKYIEEFND